MVPELTAKIHYEMQSKYEQRIQALEQQIKESAASHFTHWSPFFRNAPTLSQEKDQPFSTSLLTERRSGAYGKCKAVINSFRREQKRLTFFRVLTTPFAVWTSVGEDVSKTSSVGFNVLTLCSDAPESMMEVQVLFSELLANATLDFFTLALLVFFGWNFCSSLFSRLPLKLS